MFKVAGVVDLVPEEAGGHYGGGGDRCCCFHCVNMSAEDLFLQAAPEGFFLG